MTKTFVAKYFHLSPEDNERLVTLAKLSGQSQTKTIIEALKLYQSVLEASK